MTPYKVYIILAVLFTLSVGVLLALDASYADFLFKEDGIMEISGMVIAGIAMILALILSRIGYIRKEVWKFWLALGVLSFLFIGETLSWGKRIFSLKMPVIAGISFDAFHDILSVSIGIIKKTRDFIIEIGILDTRSIVIIIASIAVLGILFYLIIKVLVTRKKQILDFLKINLRKPPFRFLFIAMVSILIALIVDDDNLVQFPHKEVVDEGLEILAVTAFSFSCISGFIRGKWGFANRSDL